MLLARTPTGLPQLHGRLVHLFVALFALATTARAQWTVDPLTTHLRIEAELYVDQECNNVPPNVNPVPRPGPLNFQGACPPAPHLPLHANASIRYDGGNIGFNFPSVFHDFGNGLDFLVDDNSGGICSPPFFTLGMSDVAGFFQGYGLGTRSLRLFWSSELHQTGSDPDFYMRGCQQLAGDLIADFAVPQTTHPVWLRWDLETEGSADTHWECPDPGGFCTMFLLPLTEDSEHASMDVSLGLNGPAPGTVLDVDLHSDPFSGLPNLWAPQTLSQAVSYAPGTATISAALDVFAETGATTQFPYVGPFDEGEVHFGGRLRLHVIVHDFLMPPGYMRPIPRSGPGPHYAYSVGRTEITNQEYADFLNSAELDGGATGLGSFLVFGPDGTVTLPSGDLVFRPQGPAALDSHVVYSSFAPIGTRYTVDVAQLSDPRSFERHPVNHVTWFGALKFCNWLTLNQGLTAADRCYTEGPSPADWHPATISTAAWAVRDLTASERGHLVMSYRGFRLPMDELDTATGWVGQQVRPFNEWYKAAAYDPAAPNTVRSGPAGEQVPPYHWLWGTGRDVVLSRGLNTLGSGDPFDDDDAFVAMYDGSIYNNGIGPTVGSGTLLRSQASANPYGIFDLSGNVAEWGQDQVPGGGMAVRGGSYDQLEPESAATYREARPPTDAHPWLGFRVVQAMKMKLAPAKPPAPQPVSFP
jgi:formylglycine-generating enzyme required for sulfatase activity